MLVSWKTRKKGFYIGKDLIGNLDNYIKGVLNKNTSAVFVIDGRSGLGKTTVACQIGCYIANEVAKWKDKKEPLKNGDEHKPDFTLDNLTWHPDNFIERLKPAKRGDVIVMDESMILSNRAAMSSYNKAAVIMMSMVRSKQIFVIFCINSIFDLDKNLAIHRADMLIHLYAEDDKFAARGRYCVIPSSKGKLKSLYINGKKYYSYGKARAAFKDRFTSFFPFEEEEYERRKQKSIQSYFEDTRPTVHKTIISRNLLVKYMKEELNMSNKEIAKVGGVDVRTIQQVMIDLKINRMMIPA